MAGRRGGGPCLEGARGRAEALGSPYWAARTGTRTSRMTVHFVMAAAKYGYLRALELGARAAAAPRASPTPPPLEHGRGTWAFNDS